MKNLNSVSRVFSLGCLVGGLLVTPLTGWAQDNGPGRIQVRLVSVKSDGVAGWVSAIKEVAAAQEAAGRPFFHVYQNVRGDQPSFSIITLDGAYVDLPPASLDAGVIDRLQQNGNGNTLLSLAVFPELSIEGDSLEPPGEFMRVRVRGVSPRNADAYFAWHRDELTPALREAGLSDMRAGRVTLGGNTNTFVRYTYSDSVAGGGGALDIPGTVGQREFERIIEREANLLSVSEDYVYRFRADLSFTSEQ